MHLWCIKFDELTFDEKQHQKTFEHLFQCVHFSSGEQEEANTYTLHIYFCIICALFSSFFADLFVYRKIYLCTVAMQTKKKQNVEE